MGNVYVMKALSGITGESHVHVSLSVVIVAFSLNYIAATTSPPTSGTLPSNSGRNSINIIFDGNIL